MSLNNFSLTVNRLCIIAGPINPIFHNNCAFSDASMKLGRNAHVEPLLQKSPLAT